MEKLNVKNKQVNCQCCHALILTISQADMIQCLIVDVFQDQNTLLLSFENVIAGLFQCNFLILFSDVPK